MMNFTVQSDKQIVGIDCFHNQQSNNGLFDCRNYQFKTISS